MSQSQKQFRSTPSRRVSVTTAVGIAAERAALVARERDLARARAAAQRLSGVGTAIPR